MRVVPTSQRVEITAGTYISTDCQFEALVIAAPYENGYVLVQAASGPVFAAHVDQIVVAF